MSNSKYFDGSQFIELGGGTKEDLELENVDNIKQMPIFGGDFEGLVRAMTSNDLGPQLRNILFKTELPLDTEGQDGDICFVFTEEV